LGGLSVSAFLSRYWHKRPLLIRAAIPGFKNLLTPAALFRMAASEDCEARLIAGAGKRWQMAHGPFTPSDFKALPDKRWTLLMQGLNNVLPSADALMRRFSFIPSTRLDDLMVSYAVEQGGVGAHVDSYDVFLLQGEGRRRWRISAQRDLQLDPHAPLKILKSFRPEQEWILEAGDMLYLPPNIAHEGTALEPCMTYSIGFRAPSTQELATQFLSFMQERIKLAGRYADPALRAQSEPARIGDDFLQQTTAMLEGIRWGAKDIEAFVGQYLSEPKAHILFERPDPALGLRAFAQAVRRAGLRLALPSLMLYRGRHFHLNGEAIDALPAWRKSLRALANQRRLPAAMALDAPLLGQLHKWYRAGYLLPGAQHD
jgi:50S ribosomal protein L16 3-hydroxylase